MDEKPTKKVVFARSAPMAESYVKAQYPDLCKGNIFGVRVHRQDPKTIYYATLEHISTLVLSILYHTEKYSEAEAQKLASEIRFDNNRKPVSAQAIKSSTISYVWKRLALSSLDNQVGYDDQSYDGDASKQQVTNQF